MRRILFIAPVFESESVTAHDKSNTLKQTPSLPMVPLQFATLAAVTPADEFEVDIWDESWRGEIDEKTDLGKTYDLVGVTAYQAHLRRAIQLADVFHKRGIPVVIGGPGVSGTPEACRGIFDSLFLGEAELTWPRFLQEWTEGIHQKEYRQVERIDMSSSPIPKWDSIAKDIPLYALGAVQTTRGCPFDCEFCDVIHLFGRKPRHKPIENVIKEIVGLEKLGTRMIFLCDDDFVGDPKYAKQLLRTMVPVNNSFRRPLMFITQATIDNTAKDNELLELMADCNFHQLFIGIETPRAASLKETNKLQNLRTDLVAAVKKIQSYGVGVKALLILGFDADDEKIFDEHKRFLEDASPVSASISLLRAYPGTPLWIRMQQEDRVIDITSFNEKSVRAVTNIIPKQMTRIRLLQGYRDLLAEIRSTAHIEKRLTRFLAGITRWPKVKRVSIIQLLLDARKKGARKVRRRGTVSEEYRRLVLRMAFKTLRTAPSLFVRMMTLTITQIGDALVQPVQHELIEKQIDHARSGNWKLEKDPSAGKIPPDFSRKLRNLLPMLYDRLEAGIEYQPAIPVAMLGVIKDFIVRWGSSFTDFEPHHHIYLVELCSRHIERFRADKTTRSDREPSSANFTQEQIRNPQFVQAIMVGVEQELRSDAKTQRQVAAAT